MNIFQSIILGIVQGLTEFLPISSSGHLILARKIFGFGLQNTLGFDAILQFTTTLALIIYFREDIYKLCLTVLNIIFRKPADENNKKTIHSILVGSIPVVVFGLILERKMDTIFRNPKLVAVALIFGSILMFFAENSWQKRKTILNENDSKFLPEKNNKLTIKKSVVIGFFQSLALIPGVSRSGSTISGGLLSGLDRELAVRFSFLLSIPVLLGTGLKKIIEIKTLSISGGILGLLLSSLVAFVVGFISIHFLLKFLKNHKLNIFIYYRIIVALIILLIF